MWDRIFIVNPWAAEVFPPGLEPEEDGLIALGGKLLPSAVLEAYRKGIFPWTGEHPIPWYSPDPRMVLAPGEVVVSRSLRQTARRGELRVAWDRDFAGMMALCAQTPRPGQDGTWITPNMVSCWRALHGQGYAHSVEVYDADDTLVGGLYGMAQGRAFFGESMVARVPDASKLALVTLCRWLEGLGFAFIDCQQSTDHLRRMGGRDVPRATYLELLAAAMEGPDAWEAPGAGWSAGW